MKIERNQRRMSLASVFGKGILFTVMLAGLGIAAFGQDTTPTESPSPSPSVSPTPLAPFITELKGVSVGMTPAQAREKLGKPKVSDKARMYYTFGKNESAQIGIGPKGLVRTIALIYSAGDSDAPSYQDVFGPDAVSTPNEDGSIYKMIRYMDAGFWIAYSRSADKSPMTTVTMRKIE